MRVDSLLIVMGDSVLVMEIKYVMKEGNDEVVESVEVRKKKGRGRVFLLNVSFWVLFMREDVLI